MTNGVIDQANLADPFISKLHELGVTVTVVDVLEALASAGLRLERDRPGALLDAPADAPSLDAE